METFVKIKPNKKQVEFFTSNHKYTAYGGARGGGKSWAMRIKLVLLASKHPGINILLIRRTLSELRENHILPLRKLLDGVAEYRDSVKEFSFSNGSRIKLGYCDSESDVLQYQGQAYEVIGMEEATHFTYFQFQCLTECNRYSGSMSEPFTPRMYFTCNPGGVGNDWVKRLFIDRIYRENENGEDYYFIKSLVYDNDFLMSHNPEYVKTLEALPEIRRKAMLFGDWNAFEGAFFPEFDPMFHTCPDVDIPSAWIKFRALDYGLDMTACLWLAISPEREIIVYRELYEPNLILSAAASKIIMLTPPHEQIRYTVASPDLWNRRQDSGKSGFEIMAESGLRGLKRADNSRITGWRVVREYLKIGENRSVKKPRLVICKSCRNLLRTLPQLRFDENVREDISDSPHELTHAPEALRYALMSREPLGQKQCNRFVSRIYSFDPPVSNDDDYSDILY